MSRRPPSYADLWDQRRRAERWAWALAALVIVANAAVAVAVGVVMLLFWQELD